MEQQKPKVDKIDATFRVDQDIYADLMIMMTDEEYMQTAKLTSIDGVIQSYLIVIISHYERWKADRKYHDRHCGHSLE